MAVQKWVEIRHPNIDKTAIVAEVSVPHHQRSGWEPVEGTGTPPAQPQTDRQAAPRQPRPQNTRMQSEPSKSEPEGTS